MKRLVSSFLILCLLLSCAPGTVAAESTPYAEYYTTSYESYVSSMNGWLWIDYLKNDNQFGFVQFSNKMEESTLLQNAISLTIELMDGIHWNDIESPGNAGIAFYEDAILGLLVTMESELSSELDKQSEADATMTLMDYVIDGEQAAVDLIGTFAGGEAVADIFMPLLDGLAGSEELIAGAMENLKSDAQYKALARSAHLYCDFQKVLSAILIKSDNEALKIAAQNVLDGINQSFTYKLENISSYTGDTAIPELGSFVFDDVLARSIESGDITGESAVLINLFRGIDAFNAGAGIGAFIGNSVVGGHNIFLRYFEMLAMAEIRNCLIEDISQRVSSVTGPEDYNEIREIQSYLYSLLYTCQRGEYCMYSLLAKDYTGIARIVRFIFGGKTKNVDEWYASTSNVLKTAYDRIGEFTPEIEEYTFVNDIGSAYIPVITNTIQSQGSSWDTGYGALYDIDKNGIDELIMVYSQNIDNFTYKVCSVYTVSNGTAIQLIDKEPLFIEIGGPSGFVGVVRKDNNVYLAITSETGETGGGPGESINRFGSWKLYSIDGTVATIQADISYNYYFRDDDIEYENSTAVINGKTCSYTEYQKWRDSLEEYLIVEPYYYEWNEKSENIFTLKELLDIW